MVHWDTRAYEQFIHSDLLVTSRRAFVPILDIFKTGRIKKRTIVHELTHMRAYRALAGSFDRERGGGLSERYKSYLHFWLICHFYL